MFWFNYGHVNSASCSETVPQFLGHLLNALSHVRKCNAYTKTFLRVLHWQIGVGSAHGHHDCMVSPPQGTQCISAAAWAFPGIATHSTQLASQSPPAGADGSSVVGCWVVGASVVGFSVVGA